MSGRIVVQNNTKRCNTSSLRSSKRNTKITSLRREKKLLAIMDATRLTPSLLPKCSSSSHFPCGRLMVRVAGICRSDRVTATSQRCTSIITVEKAGTQGSAPVSRLRTPPPAPSHWLPSHRLSSISCLPHRNHQLQHASNMTTISTPRPKFSRPSKYPYPSAIHNAARKVPLHRSVLPATMRQA